MTAVPHLIPSGYQISNYPRTSENRWQAAAGLSAGPNKAKASRLLVLVRGAEKGALPKCMSQAKGRILKVQEGWENGFYTGEEARGKLVGHRETIDKAEAEIRRLQAELTKRKPDAADTEPLRQELQALWDRNLEESTFEERLDLVARLGIRVLPSEDLRSRKVWCRLNLLQVDGGRECSDFAKVVFGEPRRLIDRTSRSEVLSFSMG